LGDISLQKEGGILKMGISKCYPKWVLDPFSNIETIDSAK
jgi:hypothetical protein